MRRGVLAAAVVVALLAACTASDGASGEVARAGSGTAPSVAATPTPSPTPSPKVTPSRTPSCSEAALAAMPVEDKVGQLFMVGIPAGGLDASTRALLREHRPGAVILMQGKGVSRPRVTRTVADATRAASVSLVRVVVATDQEGGLVQRLSGPGFSDMPSAAGQATYPDSRLRSDMAKYGSELAAAGVTLNLAPVADVVPADVGTRNEPVGALRRGYGSDPQRVSRKVAAFVRGLGDAGVDAAVKHFPGLGRVVGNTDFTADVVDDRTTRHDPLIAPFEAGIKAGAGWLMVSSATYTRIDPDRIATFSPVVIGGMVRDGLAFDGVVVTDDIGAAAALADVAPAQRALRFFRAGGDVALTVDPRVLDDMYDATLAAARRDAAFASAVDTKVQRVLVAKQAAGLLTC